MPNGGGLAAGQRFPAVILNRPDAGSARSVVWPYKTTRIQTSAKRGADQARAASAARRAAGVPGYGHQCPCPARYAPPVPAVRRSGTGSGLAKS